jgi:DNA-binding MarR family transcriptional regulator
VYLLPMVVGLLITSVGSGQIIARTGHYKVFPIVGTATLAVALYLLSTLDETTPTLVLNLYFFVFGFSLGLIIQVLVIAVQNTVDFKDLGAATSGVTFFRTIGGSFGVSVFGAIFSNQLASQLAAALKGVTLPPGFSVATVQSDTSALKKLPADIQHVILHAYSAALHPVFLAAVPVAGVAFVFSWFLREVPLRTATGEPSPAAETVRGSASAADLGAGLGATPVHRSSAEEAERVLSRLSAVELRRFGYARLARGAGLDLSGGASWLLTRLARRGPTPGPTLAEEAGVTMEEGHPSAEQLVSRGLITRSADGVLALTPDGEATAEKLVAAQQTWLKQQLAGWSPEQHAELSETLDKLSRAILGHDADSHLMARETARRGSAGPSG